ncbi:MAG: AP2 domain-containing protein [Ignavibacteriales bacterium]|nr:AP2 domain-containing protein [Ignavibacteriales bacterium]
MSKELKHIKETSLGYYLSIKYHGSKRHHEKFYTTDYGTKEKAKEAAIQSRDKFVKANNLEPKRRYDDNLPVGVSLTKDVSRDINGKVLSVSWAYQAYWTINKKQKTKRFYINTHGAEKAKELAIKARAEGLKAIKKDFSTSTLFSEPNPSDIKIWRYMDFTKFVSILENGGLFFPSVTLLDDFFEGSASRGNMKYRSFIYSRSQHKKTFEDRIEEIKKVKKNILVNCWHMSKQESAAMWKLYAKTNEAICIQSTYKSLRKCLDKKIKIGVIRYIDYDRQWIPEDSIYYPFFYKREEFNYENEIRAMINLKEYAFRKPQLFKSLEEYGGIWVKVNLSYFIKNIFVAPNTPKWFYELVHNVVSRYKLNRDVIKSSIDSKPIV